MSESRAFTQKTRFQTVMQQKHFKMVTLIIMTCLTFIRCAKEKNISEAGLLVPRTADQDSSIPAITVNNARLHAEAFGHPDSTLLVVLHGGPGADYRYLYNCKAFAEHGFRVVFYDQRGSGLSQRFPHDSYDDIHILYDELSGVIEHYRTSPNQKVFLLGHSWGAMLATGYISAHPEAVSGAILCEPGGLKWAQVEDYVSRLFDFNLFGEAANDALFQDEFISGKEDDHAVLDYKLAMLSAAESESDSPIGNEDRLPSWRPGAVINGALFELGDKTNVDFTTNLDQFDTEVLFVYSENNTIYGEEHAKTVSSAFKNVQLFRTDGAGHDMLSFPTGWNNTFPVMLQYLNKLK